jgi:hypothetical protein
VTTIDYHGRRIRLTEAMLEALQYVLKHPKAWHNIGADAASREAVERLQTEGLVEVLEYSNQFRVKP